MPLAVHSAPVLDIVGLSDDVAACTDFDRYVNGKWHATVPMPADKGRIGSFDSLRDDSRRGKVFIHSGLKANVVALQMVLRANGGLINTAQR